MTNNTQRLLAVTLAFVLVAGIATPAFAQENPKGTPPTFGDGISTNVAPSHVEVGDAGSLPATAQIPGGAGPLTSIGGSLSQSDQEDMYEVCITDHNAFSAHVDGAQTTFDTQLFLFAQNGLGVYSNDDDGAIFVPSLLPSGDPNSPTADGIHYLAISEFDNDAINAGGEIFVDTFTLVNGPDLAAGGGSAVTGWDGSTIVGDFGVYVIDLTGVDSTGVACTPVGGESFSIDTTALLLAGAQTNAVWIMSALAVIGSVAFGALYITSKKN